MSRRIFALDLALVSVLLIGLGIWGMYGNWKEDPNYFDNAPSPLMWGPEASDAPVTEPVTEENIDERYDQFEKESQELLNRIEELRKDLDRLQELMDAYEKGSLKSA